MINPSQIKLHLEADNIDNISQEKEPLSHKAMLERRGKMVICCEGCPEAEIRCKKCSCKLYSCNGYNEAYGYPESKCLCCEPSHHRINHCCVCGACKLACLYFYLNSKCCCYACKDNRLYGCGSETAGKTKLTAFACMACYWACLGIGKAICCG